MFTKDNQVQNIMRTPEISQIRKSKQKSLTI